VGRTTAAETDIVMNAEMTYSRQRRGGVSLTGSTLRLTMAPTRTSWKDVNAKQIISKAGKGYAGWYRWFI
jgi:hypothetical protein